jgi:hypothetical protein
MLPNGQKKHTTHRRGKSGTEVTQKSHPKEQQPETKPDFKITLQGS